MKIGFEAALGVDFMDLPIESASSPRGCYLSSYKKCSKRRFNANTCYESRKRLGEHFDAAWFNMAFSDVVAAIGVSQ